MTPSFCGNSYSLGWISALFLAGSCLSELQLQRYLDLCTLTGQKPDYDIQRYIDKFYPEIKSKDLSELV